MRHTILIALCLTKAAWLFGQHTFSIVAIDTITGEIGSAGATCGDSIIWPGTPGAYIISDVIPGLGAVHTQSYWNENNQKNAKIQLEKGKTPKELIAWLEKNDVEFSPELRQYGVVAWVGNKPQAAGYTGSSCMDYKNHIVGRNYSIQGNILLGPQILDSMEARFLRAKGSLATKLMAAMQGANVAGADSRCLSEGTSSLSAFIRVAKANDEYNKLYLDINVAATAKNEEPIDVLQERFNKWAVKNSLSQIEIFDIQVYPNPATQVLVVSAAEEITSLEIFDMAGKKVFQQNFSSRQINIETALLPKGLHVLRIELNGEICYKRFLVL